MANPAALTQRRRTGKQIIGRFVLRSVGFFMATFVVAYLLDYAVLRIRIATNHSPFNTVTVRAFYTVPQKDHKEQFLLGDPTDQQCTNSLFPQLGNSPCWYLTRHPNPQINF